MPWMKLGCGECGEFEADGYDCKWRRHLQSDSHQQTARVRTLSYDAEQKKRCLAVFGLSKVPMKEVLTHFFDSNAVSDFVFWNERPDFCLVEFFSRKLRNVVAGGKHLICGVRVLLKLLDEIPDLEWQSICPSASNANSVVPTKKETGSTEASVVFDSQTSSANSNNNWIDIPSSDDEEENVENPGVSASDKIDADVTKSISSDTDEVEFVCEQKKNANAPLIEIKDDEGGLESAVGSDLELQMKKIVEAQQMSSKDWDFRVDAKDKLERHLRLNSYSLGRLIMFSLGSALIDSRMNDTLHLYLDRWGVVDEMNNPLASHQRQTHRSFHMDMFEAELSNVMSALAGTLKLPPRDKSFIVTRVEWGIGGVIDFRYTNDKDGLRCRIHLKDFDLVQSSRLLKLYCQLDDRVEPLCHVLLEWASKRSFIGKALVGVINPEVILWLAVFFLVHQRFIPPPSFLHEHHRRSKEGAEFWYSGKITSFTKDVQTVKRLMQKGNFHPANFSVNSDGKPCARVILHLAGAMFLFYSNFDFSRYSIDLFTGGLILKMDACPMSVKCHPFSFKNLTNYVYYTQISKFLAACAKSFQDLTELLRKDSTEVNESSSEAVGRGRKTPVDLLKVLHDDTELIPSNPMWSVNEPPPSKKPRP